LKAFSPRQAARHDQDYRCRLRSWQEIVAVGSGFGSKIAKVVVEQFDGRIKEEHNRPALRVTLTAPLDLGE